MDNNDGRTAQGGKVDNGEFSNAPARDGGGWRSNLQADSRNKIVNKIMESLKGHQASSEPQGLEELRNIARRFEEKIYSVATSQSDYVRRISLKMLSINPTPNSLREAPRTILSPMGSNEAQPSSQKMPNNIAPSSPGLTSAMLHVGGMSQGTVPPNVPVQNANLHNIQNMTGVDQSTAGASTGLGPGPAPQRQMQGRPQQQPQSSQQYLYNQQLQQNPIKPNLQQGNAPQSMMQNLLQPNQLQSSRQGVMQSSLRQMATPSTVQSGQLSSLQQSTQSVLQQQSQSVRQQQQLQTHQMAPMPQNPMIFSHQPQQRPNAGRMPQSQLVGKPSNVFDAQQQPQRQQRVFAQTIHPQNTLQNVHQQQLGVQQNSHSNVHRQHQSNISSFQPLQMGGIQHCKATTQPNQQPVHGLQQQSPQNMGNILPNQSQQLTQFQSQPGQMQRQQGLQHPGNLLQKDIQQKIQTSGPLLQQQTTIDLQMQSLQNQRLVPDPSLNQSIQTGNFGEGDWQEEVYQKIKSMHDMYYSELNEMYRRIAAKLQQHDAVPQQPKNEHLEKLRIYKSLLEQILMFLQTSKIEILPSHREKVAGCEKQIFNILNNNRPRKPQGQFSQLQMQAMQQSLQQQAQVPQVHDEHQMNSQMQQMNAHGSSMAAQQNNLMSLQQSPSSSSAAVALNLRQSMVQQKSMQQPNQINNANDAKMRHLMRGNPRVIQQHASSGSPKSGTPLQSVNSPLIASSPLTSVAPSPAPVDSDKINHGMSLPSNAENVINQSPVRAAVPSQSPAIGIPGTSASPLLAEFATTEGAHGAASTVHSGSSGALEQPLQRLMKAVKSMSSNKLTESVSDVSTVVTMADRIAGCAPGNGSGAVLGEDLFDAIKCRHLQDRDFFMQDEPVASKKMRRFTSAVPSNVVSSTGSVTDDLRHLSGNESDGESSGATSSVKKPRVEANFVLKKEVEEINRRLIDTVVCISEDDVDRASGGGGIVVKCSYSAVALSDNLKSQFASAQMSPIQPLRLLVPNNYPNCSPIVLDNSPPVEVSEKCEDLSSKAKSRFSESLRALDQSMSLSDMAKSWEICARAVISEYAQQSGGGIFSSKYGEWENCVCAS